MSEQYKKGVEKIHSTTREEQKQYRKEVIEFTRSLIEKGITGYEAKKRALMEKYGVTDRMAKKYIKYTKEDIEGKRNESLQTRRDNLLIQWEGVFREAKKAGDNKTAIEALKEIAKIEGQHAPKQVNIRQETTTKTDLSHLSTEQLLQMRNLLSGNNNKTIDIPYEEV